MLIISIPFPLNSVTNQLVELLELKLDENFANSLFILLRTCGEVVERASWVASYDEWSEKLNLTFGERSKLKEFYAPSNKLDHQKKEFNIPNDNKVWVPKERNIPVSLKEQGQIKDPMAIERMKELYSMGTYYLYGMLFHEIFPFHESVKPSADLVGVDEDEISIVLHSRHVKVRQYLY